MNKKDFKKALFEFLPPVLFHWLRNYYRKRLRAQGQFTEVYVSSWPKTNWVNGHRRFICRKNRTDQITFHQVFRDQEYNLGHLPRSKDMLQWYQQLSKPVILDCGANIGASTLFLAESYAKAVIVAVEPDSQNFSQLCQNTAGIENIIAINAAVCADDGWIRIVNPTGEPNSFRTERCAEAAGAIRAVSIQHLLDRVAGQPYFLKVDIEGGESDLFQDHHELLHQFPIVAVEIHDWLLSGKATSRNFLDWHLQGDRDLLIHHEMLYSVVNHFAPA